MARSIDDSLNLLSSSLTNINNSLVSKGLDSTSGLKLSQVADKIRQVETVKYGTLDFTRVKNGLMNWTINGIDLGNSSFAIKKENNIVHNFTLTGENTNYIYQLETGEYTITCTSNGSSYRNTPSDINFTINADETTTIRMSFTIKTMTVNYNLTLTGTLPTAGVSFDLDTKELVNGSTNLRRFVFSSARSNFTGTLDAPYGNLSWTFHKTDSTSPSTSGTVLSTASNKNITTTLAYGDPPNPEEPWFEGMSTDEPKTLEFTEEDQIEIPVEFKTESEVENG